MAIVGGPFRAISAFGQIRPLGRVFGCPLFIPFVYVTVLAVMRRIPPALYRSAQADGAPRFQQWKFVTFHQIKKALVVILILRLAFMFTKFDTPWLLGARTSTDKLHTLPIY